MTITPWLRVRARFIGKEGHHVYESHQFGQSVPVLHDRIRTDRDDSAAVPSHRGESALHSHVHPNAVCPDYDVGCDARWLFEGRLGHTRPASPRVALVVVGTH